jgi:hypothetical protein
MFNSRLLALRLDLGAGTKIFSARLGFELPLFTSVPSLRSPGTFLSPIICAVVIPFSASDAESVISSPCSVPVMITPSAAQSGTADDRLGRSLPVIRSNSPAELPGPVGVPSMTSIKTVKSKPSVDAANVPVIRSTGPARSPASMVIATFRSLERQRRTRGVQIQPQLGG